MVLIGIPTEFDEYMGEWLPLEAELQRAYNAPEVRDDVFSANDLDIFARCLRRMLVVDQAKRPTTRELVTEEEWFRDN